jgi:hypothetical protein
MGSVLVLNNDLQKILTIANAVRRAKVDTAANRFFFYHSRRLFANSFQLVFAAPSSIGGIDLSIGSFHV